MFYKPIYSDEAKDNENQNVCILGKIIEVKYERKYTKLKILDKNGYINCVTFDPITFDEFKTALFLGYIKKFRDEYNLYIKKFVYLDLDDELYWREKFVQAKKSLYNPNKNYNEINNKENKEKIENNSEYKENNYNSDKKSRYKGKHYRKNIEKHNNKTENENNINIEKNNENNNINNESFKEIRDENSNNKNKKINDDQIIYDIEEDENLKLIKKVLDIIKTFDEGEGVSKEIIMNYVLIDDDKLNQIIEKLLSEGEIYEFMPGKYKLL